MLGVSSCFPKRKTIAIGSQKDTATSKRDQSIRSQDNDRVVSSLFQSTHMACSSGGSEMGTYMNLMEVVVNGSKQMGLGSISTKQTKELVTLFF